MSISLEAKLKALREVESIYRLSKKWQRLTPDEKRPNWERIADAILKKAMGTPLQSLPAGLNVRRSKQHHTHSPRTARVIERTLRNGIVHPDVLHSYRNDKVEHGSTRVRYQKPVARPDSMPAQHYVQGECSWITRYRSSLAIRCTTSCASGTVSMRWSRKYMMHRFC